MREIEDTEHAPGMQMKKKGYKNAVEEGSVLVSVELVMVAVICIVE